MKLENKLEQKHFAQHEWIVSHYKTYQLWLFEFNQTLIKYDCESIVNCENWFIEKCSVAKVSWYQNSSCYMEKFYYEI